jgi:peptidoglycan L-alanyl-D-glutamate endopeptidase CwlK
MSFDAQSEACLAGVHPDLVAVVRKARDACPFRITEGKRTTERQKQLVAQGKSRTMNSRHLTGHAVDLVDPEGTYAEPEMKAIAEAMKAAAGELGIAITWGGDWASFQDTPHFELEWHAYPKTETGSKIKGGLAGLGIGGLAVPQVPAEITTNITNVQAWQGLGDNAAGILKWGIASPLALTILAATAGLFWLQRHVRGKLWTGD